MDPVYLPALFGAIAAIVCLIALWATAARADWTARRADLFAALAAGLVITLSITHLTPEALALAPQAPLLVLAGFTGGLLVQWGVETGARGRSARILAFAPVLAIALHSTLDGVVYGVTFSVDVFTGLAATTGLILHEFPEAILCFALLQRAGLGTRAAFGLAFLAAGATTLIAAAATGPFAAGLPEARLGQAFAVTAGLLLHVGASHLFHHPEAPGGHGHGAAGRGSSLLAVLAGGAIALAMTAVHVHPHGEADHETHDHHHPHDHSHDAGHFGALIVRQPGENDAGSGPAPAP